MSKNSGVFRLRDFNLQRFVVDVNLYFRLNQDLLFRQHTWSVISYSLNLVRFAVNVNQKKKGGLKFFTLDPPVLLVYSLLVNLHGGLPSTYSTIPRCLEAISGNGQSGLR